MELKFKNLFKPSVFSLRLSRAHPKIKKDTKWLVQFLLLHVPYTLIFVIIVYNVFYINYKKRDFTLMCKNGVLAVVYIVISFLYCVLLWKSKYLITLMNSMKNDYKMAEMLPVDERDIIREYAKRGGLVSKQWMWLTYGGASLFPIKNLFVNLYFWYNTGELNLIPIYELVFPNCIESRHDNLLVYFVFYWFSIVFFCSFSALIYTGFVPLGPIFMLHASGQLVVLKSRIAVLFVDDNDVDEIKIRLKVIIQRLQYIYGFIETIQIAFRVVYEVTLKGSSIILPIIGFQIIESLKNGEVSLEIFSVFVGGILISASPCYYSNLLMDKGDDIRLAVYSCGWEKVYDRGIRSTLGVLQRRAIRSAGIRSLFRDVSLVTLSEVFQQAYTIFNLMNCMWN